MPIMAFELSYIRLSGLSASAPGRVPAALISTLIIINLYGKTVLISTVKQAAYVPLPVSATSSTYLPRRFPNLPAQFYL